MKPYQATWINWLLIILGVVVVGSILVSQTVGGQPDNMEEAWNELWNAKTIQIKSDLTIKLPPTRGNREQPFHNITTRLEGSLVKQDGTAFSGKIYGEARGRGNVLFTDGEIRVVDNEVFFRLDNLPVILNQDGNLVNKWTVTRTGTLQPSNSEEIKQALTSAMTMAQAATDDRLGEEKMWRFTKTMTEAEKDNLIAAMRKEKSLSPAWDSWARFLGANQIRKIDVWVSKKDKQIRQVNLMFIREGANEEGELTLTLTNYGQPVAVAKPKAELRVKPEIFAKLLRTG